MYKQHRFNLQREETEGFAKLLVLLAGVRDGSKAGAQSEENMRRLIGYFDLDPNRCVLCACATQNHIYVRVCVVCGRRHWFDLQSVLASRNCFFSDKLRASTPFEALV